MSQIDPTSPVMVTGGSGYLASWIIKMLLEDGVSVHATVRDPLDTDKVGHLKALAGKSKARLILFKSDLLEPNSFDDPMKECKHLFLSV